MILIDAQCISTSCNVFNQINFFFIKLHITQKAKNKNYLN